MIDELPPPITGDAVWYGPEMASRTDWIHEITDEEVAEIEAAMRQLSDSGVEISTITKEDFPLPTFSARLYDAAQQMMHGRGFSLMRGLPIDSWSIRDAATAYFGIGQHMGPVRPQNARGHILGHVKDLGRDAEKDPLARVYETRERQGFHTDRSDVVSLLCLKTAKSGGASSLVSSLTIYNEMYERAPDLLRVLFEPFPMDRRGEVAPGQKEYSMTPVYSECQGYISAYYVPRYIQSASRFDDAPKLTQQQKDALAMLEEIANDPKIHMEMAFLPGDIQWVYNHTTFHDRTGYEDWSEDERKRHLLRLWVSLPGDRPLHDVYRDRWGEIDPGQRGGTYVAVDKLVTPLEAA